MGEFKEYVNLDVNWGEDGDIMPLRLYLEGGGVYEVDRVLGVCNMASRKSGGFGIRYTVRTSCEDEEVYNKMYYLFRERGTGLDRWFIEEA